MSIVMHAKMRVLPTKRQELFRTLEAMGKRFWREGSGCRGFRFYKDQKNECLIDLTVEWQDQENLDQYLESSHGILLGAINVLCEAPVITFCKTLSKGGGFASGEV